MQLWRRSPDASFLPTVTLAIVMLIFAAQHALSESGHSSASIGVDSAGSLHITSKAGQDVILNGVSVNQTFIDIEFTREVNNQVHAEVSSLLAQRMAIRDELSTATSSLTLSTSQLTSQFSEMLRNPWRHFSLSSCPVRQTAQQLSGYFKSFASFASENGTMYLIAEQSDMSYLYKYSDDPNTGFVIHQPLGSAPITYRASAFTIESKQFVALPFFFDGATHDYRCELFVFDEASHMLVSVQNISTFGVIGVSAITAPSGVSFLAVSNYFSYSFAHNYSPPSYIMRYDSTASMFKHWQNFTTIGTFPPEFIQVGGNVFLMFPSFFDGSSPLQNSDILVLQPSSGLFVQHQIVATNGASHMKPWRHNAQTYLSIVNRKADSIDVYVFNSSISRFVNITSGSRLLTINPTGVDVIAIAGSIFMAVSPSGTNVYIFKWNSEQTRFEQTQNITLNLSAVWSYPHFFTIGVDVMLALWDRIYKFCGGQFVFV
jgi:hypothetical protein